MINLDAIIPYQPPLPHKPPKSSKIAPLPLKPPALTHPLPQKPDARDQTLLSPFQSCQSLSSFDSIPADQGQTSRRPSSTNAFDTELAAWSDMAINHTTVMSTTTEDQGEGRQPRNDSDVFADNSESRSSDFREPERPRSPYEQSTQPIHDSQRYGTHDSAASEPQSEHAIPVAIAHADDVEALHSNYYASDLQSAEALMPQPDVDVRSGGLESQDVPDDEWELTPSGIPLNMVPSVSRGTGLERQDQNDNHDNLPSCEDGYLTDEAASIHSKEPAPFASVSSERNGTRPRENCAVAVVIPTALPAAQPPQSHKRPSRLRSKTQTYRTDLLNESDEFDDSDDDDYIDRSQHVEHKRRSTKRPKYQPIANSVPMKPQVVGGFQLGNLSLPNLRTVQRGLLTCEFFQSKVVYSFSWTEDRECSDDRSPNEANTPSKEHSGCEMNDIHGWDLHSPSKEENTRIIRDNQRDCHLSTYSSQLKARETEPEKPRKRNKEWTSEEEDLLRQLKDKDKLLWPQIREFFPNRTEGAIKLRYHTIHKNSAARSRVPSSRAHRRGSNVSSSPPAVLQNRKRHALDTTEPRRRSRPARARGVVERLSP